MTVGARIAQKRKELGLSQEALGEKLCVSRQAIYKWESDTALPEIEKLVALSRLFEVPVGWLLGVEEDAETEEPKGSGELNETQIKMVEEIVGRYLAAQPQPKKPRRGLRILAAVIVVAVGFNLFSRLEGLDNRYSSLQNAVSNMNWSVNSQIGSIAGRVEEILKAQNDLTADYGTELIGVDLFANTATFRLRAVAKTFVEGMDAVFLINSGAGPVEVAATLSAGGVFSAEADTALTDKITLSVVFVDPDGTRRTQLLDTYTDLLYETTPDVNVSSSLLWLEAPGGTVKLGQIEGGAKAYVDILADSCKELATGNVEVWVTDLKVGVFVNKQLVDWARECDQPDSFAGDWGNRRFFQLPDVEVTLGEEDLLCIAVLVTDNYGRQLMVADNPYEVRFDGKGGGELSYASRGIFDPDPANWTLVTGEVWNTTTTIGGL